MKLQHKAWLLIVMAVILMTLVAVSVTSLTIFRSFADLEQSTGEREGERARRLLNQQLEELMSTTRDYGYWDDAVNFVLGTDDAFLVDNITEENMQYLRLTEVVVMDRAVSIKAAARLVDGQGLVMEPSELKDVVAHNAKVVLADDGGLKTVGTYVRRGNELYMIAVVTIRDPTKPDSPTVGALAMVRRFDHKELLRFSKVLMAQVSLELPDVPHDHGAVWVHPLTETRAEVHAAIENAEGEAVAQLVIGMDRVMTREASKLLYATGIQVLLAGLVLGGLLVFLMDRWVLRRLNRMHDQLELITAQGVEEGSHIRMGGQDELKAVAQGINALLDRVRQDAASRREAQLRHDELQLQLMQSQKMEAIGRFTGGIAHDINNSLAGINGWIRVAMEDLPVDHPGVDALERALKGSGYAGGLMRQLLAFSRQTEPRLERLNLSDVVERARSLTAAGMLKRTEVIVGCSPGPALDQVMADPTQLQQVLVNLLINASDAMGGEGRIHIAMESLSWPGGDAVPDLPGVAGLPSGDYLQLTICDEGPGIAPEHLDRIFEPFFTTKAVGRGTGLGLSVAHGIMGRHQGSIGVSSQVGEGSCFHLYLPAVGQSELSESQMADLEKLVDRRLRILLVDDDELIRHAWSSLLERRGWDVVRARDGDEGWLMFRQSDQSWDIVLTDLAMPNMDGLELSSKILATDDPPPVVLISAHVDSNDRDSLLATGLTEVITKPLDASELASVLYRIVRQRKAASEKSDLLKSQSPVKVG